MACRSCASECLCAVIGTDGAVVTGDGAGPTPYTVRVLRNPAVGNLISVSASGVLVSTESVQDVVGAMVPSPLAYDDPSGTIVWSGGVDGQILTRSGSIAVWSSLGSGGSTAMTTAASTTTMTTSGVTDPTVGFAGGSTGSLAFLTETFTLRAGCGMEIQIDATGSIYSMRPAVFTFASTGYSVGSCITTSGAPIFCDSAGRLRSVPDHRSLSSRTVGSTTTPQSFVFLLALGANAVVTINNPSPCRAMHLFVGLETYFDYDAAVGQGIQHQIQIFNGLFTGIFTKHAYLPYRGAANSRFMETSITTQAGSIAASGSVGFNHSLLWDAQFTGFVGGNHVASDAVTSLLGTTT